MPLYDITETERCMIFDALEILQPDGDQAEAMRQALCVLFSDDDVPSAAANGPYSPALAEAFRQGARDLFPTDFERVCVEAGARVEEYEEGDGGAVVHCLIYVSDGERALMPDEEAGEAEPKPGRSCPRCGSEEVYKDAAAAWNREAQEWELCSVHDSETCSACDAEGDWLTERD